MLIRGHNRLPEDVRAVLLIQLGDIGDVILTVPTVRALRERYPGARLVVAVRDKARELMEDCPWVSEVAAVTRAGGTPGHRVRAQRRFFSRLRRTGFDLAVDVRSGTRGAVLAFLSGASVRIGRYARHGGIWRNRMFTHLVDPPREEFQYSAEHSLNIVAPFGLSTTHRRPELILPEARLVRGTSIMDREGIPRDRPVVAVHPCSLWRYKEWKPDRWPRVIDHLVDRFGVSIILTGSADERPRVSDIAAMCRARVVNLAGKTSIGELPAVLCRCAMFVGVDTGALHAAAAVGTPTAALFGPSSPVNWAPRGRTHLVVSKPVPCIHCRRKGCGGGGISLCLDGLTVEEVQTPVDRHLAGVLAGRVST